jgi:hypothetical protein
MNRKFLIVSFLIILAYNYPIFGKETAETTSTPASESNEDDI